MTMSEHKHHEHIPAHAAWQLMSPHTWVAAVAPVALGVALVFGLDGFTSARSLAHIIITIILMLITSIALQSAVNTFNDYSDFIKGTDTAENVIDETDSAIIYNHLDPHRVLHFGITLLAIALKAGVSLVLMSTWHLLVLGFLAAAVVMLYSFGPKPISYLPLGELVSGAVMGGIITMGTYLALTKQFDPLIFVYAIPVIIGIGVIMQINNTCDIDKDIEAGRKTLPILLGKKRSIQMIVWLSILAIVIIAAVGVLRFPVGLLAIFVFAFPLYRNLRTLENDPYDLESRSHIMKTGVKQVALTTAYYVSVIVIGTALASWGANINAFG